jgi:hypothetical protein
LKIAPRFSGFGASASHFFRGCLGGGSWGGMEDPEACVGFGDFDPVGEGFVGTYWLSAEGFIGM